MPADGRRKLYVVGIGPGSLDLLTPMARAALEAADCVIGNASYLEALKPLLGEKEILRSAMGQEIERARQAVRLSRDRVVAIVSGGDPGVYGMASIVLEIRSRTGSPAPVVVIPGVTAAHAAAARLGSPLSGDHVVISLSDLLTPWEEIERRLRLALAMRVPVVLYNPRSRNRPHHLYAALTLARELRDGGTPVAMVKNAYRPEEEQLVTVLSDSDEIVSHADMHSTVIIGGDDSYLWKEGEDARGFITPRGYHRKYVY